MFCPWGVLKELARSGEGCLFFAFLLLVSFSVVVSIGSLILLTKMIGMVVPVAVIGFFAFGTWLYMRFRREAE